MPAEGHKSRRALLRLFGAAPALAILPAATMFAKPAVCAPDPVYAAIAEHKRPKPRSLPSAPSTKTAVRMK